MLAYTRLGSEIMSTYKEIVTKAVIGKGKKYYKNTYTINTDNVPSNVLGCWVINHKFKGTEVNGKIVITGSFDVNIWYSYDNDTKTTVITKTIDYSESVTVKQKYSSDNGSKDIIIRSLKQPNCINAKEKDKTITLEIEKELGIEIVGDTKVKIAIEDDEEPWETIMDDDSSNKLDEEIDKEVNPEYLNSDKEVKK